MTEQDPQEDFGMLGRHRLVKKLAVGGMAEVFLAQTMGVRGFVRPVVVKRMLPHLASDKVFVDMFIHEARIVGALDHPNIGQIYELGEDSNTYYMVMEYLDGGNLRQLCFAAQQLGVPIPYLYLARIISLAAAGLGYAHRKIPGLIHRDVSPDNIMLSRHGEVKVVDFGVAKAANVSHLTRTGVIKGKLNYMPPEQMKDEDLDGRVDVFALGVCAYEMMSGIKPFDGSSDAKVMHSILHETLRPITDHKPDVPPILAGVIHRALEKDRTKRYQGMRELQADIEKFLAASRAEITPQRVAGMVEELIGPDENVAALQSPVFETELPSPASGWAPSRKKKKVAAPTPEPSFAISVGTSVGTATPQKAVTTVLWQKSGKLMRRRPVGPLPRHVWISRWAAALALVLATAMLVLRLGASSGRTDRPPRGNSSLEHLATGPVQPSELLVLERARWGALAQTPPGAQARANLVQAAESLARASSWLEAAVKKGAPRSESLWTRLQAPATDVHRLSLALVPEAPTPSADRDP